MKTGKERENNAKADIWAVVATFYEAQTHFQETYDTYEERVLHFAAERGVDRRVLRLEAKELTGLLDFKQLEVLRDAEVEKLKTYSHQLFRKLDTTNRFDRHISEIYHELSILKEEQYRVEQFGPDYATDKSPIYNEILDEVHQAFPRKVHHIYDLFRLAQERLESVLPNYISDKTLIRSVYLFGEDLIGPQYTKGLPGFYKILYGPGGAIEGFTAAAKSFIDSGFKEYAKEALEKALAFAKTSPPSEPEAVKILVEAKKLFSDLKKKLTTGKRTQKKTAAE